MATRVYEVKHKKTGESRLIRAAAKQGARGYAARSEYEAKVASQDRLIELTGAGVKVEDATAPEQEDRGAPAEAAAPADE